ncbi:MAG: hypothetical protein F9K44_14735 [Hyphomicrobiaceae bacterium]|nr:MAG: hypothetical protein F9K44_14735 [Hyphomicrobiaceae bacterium]
MRPNAPPPAEAFAEAIHAPYYEERQLARQERTAEPDFGEALRTEVAPYVTARQRAREQTQAQPWHEAAAHARLNGHHNGHTHQPQADTAANGARIALEVPRDMVAKAPAVSARTPYLSGPIPAVKPANRNTAPAPQLPHDPSEERQVPDRSVVVEPPSRQQTGQKEATDEAIGIVRSVIAVNAAVNGRLKEKVTDLERQAVTADRDQNVTGIESGAALAEQAQWAALPPSWDSEQKQALLPSPSTPGAADGENKSDPADPSAIAKRFARRGK